MQLLLLREDYDLHMILVDIIAPVPCVFIFRQEAQFLDIVRFILVNCEAETLHLSSYKILTSDVFDF